jgi:hypothetical protein
MRFAVPEAVGHADAVPSSRIPVGQRAGVDLADADVRGVAHDVIPPPLDGSN